MEPLVSVITPIYKAEKYLEKCVRGLMDQTYQNLEIILVDDGSPDHSGEICEQLAAEDGRIKVIHKENGGAATARNAGLDAMTGDYIAFVDADDYMQPDYIENLYKILKEKNAQVAICGFETVDEEGHTIAIDALHDENRNGNIPESENRDIAVRNGNDIILEDLQGHWEHVAPWGKLFEADLYRNVRYPKWFAHEDEPVFIQVFDQVQTVAVTSKKLYYYVQHAGSLMNTAYSEKDRSTLLTMWRERLVYYKDGKEEHRSLYIQVKQAYIAWNVLYLALHADQMTKEQQKELKREICRYFWSLFQKPFLFDRNYSFKMAVKCLMTLINPDILRKRYL